VKLAIINYAYESLYMEVSMDKSGSKAEKKEKTCQSNGIQGATGADTPKANISRWEMKRRQANTCIVANRIAVFCSF
jgi:hypothetical protein